MFGMILFSHIMTNIFLLFIIFLDKYFADIITLVIFVLAGIRKKSCLPRRISLASCLKCLRRSKFINYTSNDNKIVQIARL